MMRENVKRGDIYYIEPYYAVGSEQHAGRPAIVVSNDINNVHSPTFEVVYLTTQEKNQQPTHVKIFSAPRDSVALCEQINTVAEERIGDYCGRATDEEMDEIDKALAVSISICNAQKADDGCMEKLAAAEKRYKKLKAMYDDLLRRFIEEEAG